MHRYEPIKIVVETTNSFARFVQIYFYSFGSFRFAIKIGHVGWKPILKVGKP